MKHFFIVYLYLLSFILSAQWQQFGGDILGENFDDKSGYSVSINADGNIIATGEPNYDGTSSDIGRVKVYIWQANQWQQLGNDIVGDESLAHFGFSLDLNLDGTILAIGAPDYNTSGANDSGRVSVYQFVNNDWQLVGNHIGGDYVNNKFGYSVSVNSSGDTVVVGAPENSDNGSQSGQIKVYKLYNGVWQQIGSAITGVSSQDKFGTTVAISGDGTTIAAGAPFNDDNGSGTGHIRIFKFVNNDWIQAGQTITGESIAFNIGEAIDLNENGNIIVSGEPYAYNNASSLTGRVRVFTLNNNYWEILDQELFGTHSFENFGASVSINPQGDKLAIGSPYDNTNGSDSGSIEIYFLDNNNHWELVNNRILGFSDENFGYSVDLNSQGDTFIAGLPFADYSNNIDSGGCRIYNNPALNVSEMVFENLKIFPNPVYNNIFVSGITSNKALIELYTLEGKKLMASELKKSKLNEINLKTYPPGIYLLKINLGKDSYFQKIIISSD